MELLPSLCQWHGRQTLASDYVAQTQSEGCLTQCRDRCCPWLREHKCNHIVIVSFCPRRWLLVKGEVPLVESPAPYLWCGRFHFHHAIRDWTKKQVSMTKEASLFRTLYNDKSFVGVWVGRKQLWDATLIFYTVCVVSQQDTMTLSCVLKISTRHFQIIYCIHCTALQKYLSGN